MKRFKTIGMAALLAVGLAMTGMAQNFPTVANTPAPAAAAAPLTIAPGSFVSTGGSLDYSNKQASSLSSLSWQITSIAGLPTYSTTSIEFSVARQANGTISANTISARSGITQVLFQRKNFFVFVLTDTGIYHFDAATLLNTSGGIGFGVDVVSVATKGKYHGYIAPIAREVSIASQQIKPVFGLQFIYQLGAGGK